ncbi:hypothetical protein GGI35DRAFT_438906 [Trichoderma velutinum]
MHTPMVAEPEESGPSAPNRSLLLPRGAVPPVTRNPLHASRRKARRLACRECRQCKIRCEGSGSSSQSCARCQKLGLTCVYDVSYKRIHKQSKLEELSEEVRCLRASLPSAVNTTAKTPDELPLSLLGNEDATDSQEANSSRGTPTVLSGQPGRISEYEPVSSSRNGIDMPNDGAPRSLGAVNISSHLITRSFQIYLTDYHPHMPILDENITPDDCYKRSPLLFWTVIAIAARRFEEEPTLLASLSSGIKELLWRTVGNPPHTGLDLKAMVLICLWPFPTSSMSTDMSYFVASTVKTSAMHVGVHKPFNMEDFSRVKVNLHLDELKDALATWAACFVAAESTTAYIGQPPLFVADTTLEVISQPISRLHVPRTLYEMSVIFLLCNKFHTAMAHGDNGVAAALIPVFSRELRELRQQLGPHICRSTNVVLQFARLQLRNYHFLEPAGASTSREGILDGYHTAKLIVQELSKGESEEKTLTRGPILFQNALAIASVYILKIMRSKYSRLVDIVDGESMFKLSITLLRKCSIEDNDLPGRLSKILLQLWSKPPDLGSLRDELSVQTRLAGSLLQDFLWRWRETFGNQSRGPQFSGTGDENFLPLSPESIRVFSSSASSSQPRAGNFSRDAPGVTGAVLDMSVVDGVDNGWLWDYERHPSFPMAELDITSLLS